MFFFVDIFLEQKVLLCLAQKQLTVKDNIFYALVYDVDLIFYLFASRFQNDIFFALLIGGIELS